MANNTLDSFERSFDNFTCGMIFEFKEMEKAKAFAEAVKSGFDLDGRVFDNAEAAARAHPFPWVQYPPVVHIDRPYWKLDKHAPEEAWNNAFFDIERQIEALAQKFDGEFIGT
jgi:hypothetical protein